MMVNKPFDLSSDSHIYRRARDSEPWLHWSLQTAMYARVYGKKVSLNNILLDLMILDGE